MTNEETLNETTADKAFTDAAIGYEFNGLPLKPWSGSREIAAQAMGMKAPGLTEADIADIAGGRIYRGGLRDAIICMWICSTPNASEQTVEDVKAKRWTVQRAGNNPDGAVEEAERWAMENGIRGLGSDGFVEAYKVMFAMLNGVAVSAFDVKSEGGEGDSDGSGKI